MTTLKTEYTTKPTVLYIGIELSAAKWLLSFRTNFTKCRNKTIDSWSIAGLVKAIDEMKKRFDLDSNGVVKSCYEAGQDAFSVHRQLEKLGIDNIVVDSASIETNRRKKRLKTDRIDGEKLSGMLLRYNSGEKGLWRIAVVPTEEEEDLRRTHREIDRLQKEVTSHKNRIRMLLKTHGVKVGKIGGKGWTDELDKIKMWDSKALPEHLLSELKRESARLVFVKNQIKEIEKYQQEQLEASDSPVIQKVLQIGKLKGIGYKSAWLLVMEWFGWRRFNNVKEVGAAAGLVGVRRASGEMSQEQGISKVGNPKIRTLMVELSWIWLRYQPDHPLSIWFRERFDKGGRLKRIGIVALARKLLILIWKFVERGELAPATQLKVIAAK